MTWKEEVAPHSRRMNNLMQSSGSGVTGVSITITEALAELRTLEKRLEKKRAFVVANLHMPQHVTDVFAEHGGLRKVVERELQSIQDLEARVILIRDAITAKNRETELTLDVAGMPVTVRRKNTVHQWLIWRREVAQHQVKLRKDMVHELEKVEGQVRDKVMRIQTEAEGAPKELPFAMTYAVDRKAVVDELDALENVLGKLDGALTLSNSRTAITLPT